MEWVELFCDVDDFCQDFEPRWQQRLIMEGERQRRRECIDTGVVRRVEFHRLEIPQLQDQQS